MTAPRVVAIVGPTGSGKSDLAIEAALRIGGEVISFDSVQVYRGLDIGSGKAPRSARDRVRHHLVDILEPGEEMNAAIFAERAGAAIREIHARGRRPILAGGTGLYLTALLKGLFPEGAADPRLRQRLDDLATRYGAPRLHRRLSFEDPEYARKTSPTDRIRIIRALEVVYGQRRSFTEAQADRVPAWSGETLIVGLDPGREMLRERVERRVRSMLDGGLIAETKSVLGAVRSGEKMPRALSSIGYREVVERLAANPDFDRPDLELQRAIVVSTMQYAKRQMTYFRRQFSVEWFREPAAALERIDAWSSAGLRDGREA